MGKIRTRILGLADIEKQQKEEQKTHAEEKAEKAEAKEERAAVAKKNEEQTAKVNVSKKVRGKKYLEAKKKLGEVKKNEVTRGS